MADKITVDTEKMKFDSDILKLLIDKLPDERKKLEEVLVTLSGTWEGDSFNAFQEQMYNDLQYISEVYLFLNNYLKSFEDARHFYQNATVNVFEELRVLGTKL